MKEIGIKTTQTSHIHQLYMVPLLPTINRKYSLDTEINEKKNYQNSI